MGIIALSGYQERFWCRNLCPYGGLLALISRVSWLRHYIKMDGCIHCKKCELQSRMGCYDNLDKNAKQEEMHSISECIQCFRCETICPTDVIQIQAKVPASIKEALGMAAEGHGARAPNRRPRSTWASAAWWRPSARACCGARRPRPAPASTRARCAATTTTTSAPCARPARCPKSDVPGRLHPLRRVHEGLPDQRAAARHVRDRPARAVDAAPGAQQSGRARKSAPPAAMSARPAPSARSPGRTSATN